MKHPGCSVLPMLMLFFFTGCKPSAIDVSGQIFIVTNAGQSVKLGLVEVAAFSEDSVKLLLDSKISVAKKDIERINAMNERMMREWEAALDERNYRDHLAYIHGGEAAHDRANKASDLAEAKRMERLDSLRQLEPYNDGSFYVTGLPTPLQTAKSDADGKFSLKLLPGRYILIALSRRMIADETENYCWIIRAAISSEHPDVLMLSNDNLLGTSCTDCVVKVNEFTTVDVAGATVTNYLKRKYH